MRLTFPVYNPQGLAALCGPLSPYVRPDDTVMLVSGNVDKALSVPWLGASLGTVRPHFPQVRTVAATAGREHLGVLAASGLPVDGLVYIYEPGFANVPEFSWEAAATERALEDAAARAHAGGYPLVFKPTGRPLLQRPLARHGWDYGRLAARCDALFVQTQTYCPAGTFADALAKLAHACAAHLETTYVQVTVDAGARNGVPPAQAAACLRSAAQPFAGATLWWSPRFVVEARRCLELLRPH